MIFSDCDRRRFRLGSSVGSAQDGVFISLWLLVQRLEVQETYALKHLESLDRTMTAAQQCGIVDGGTFSDCAIQDVSTGTHATTATYNKGNRERDIASWELIGIDPLEQLAHHKLPCQLMRSLAILMCRSSMCLRGA